LSTGVDKPARVLHLAAGNLFGGLERIVVECAASRGLCRSMDPAFAVCFDGRLAAELEHAGAGCARLGDVRVSRPHTVIRARRALGGLLDTLRPDAVICHSAWTFGLAAPAVRAHGALLALWIHDPVSGRSWPERWARLTTPDVLIANSHFTARTIPTLYPDVRPSVLYAPVAPAPTGAAGARAEVRRALGADATTFVILIASRFEEWKGHRALVTAAAALDGNWRLWIAGRPQRAGEDAYELALQEMARTIGVADRVAFLGERTDVPALMQAADVLCQPNTAPEPFGLAFIEALHAGLPVVTTDAGGAREIVTPDCGVLVAQGDDGALRDALNRLAHDAGERRRLSLGGPPRAHALCDPARQLTALAELITRRAVMQVPA
jgi:glycosyltransferase involved in cell wall biosynthesis